MTAALNDVEILTVDELAVINRALGIDSLPSVFTMRSPHASVDVRDAARALALRNASTRGLINAGGVEPGLTSMIEALHRPHRELSAWLVTPEGPARICVVRCGSLCVLARSTGKEVGLKSLGHALGLADVTATLLGELPSAAAAPIEPVGAPLAEVTRSLADSHDALQLTDQIRALGASPRAASLLGAALGCRQAFAEITYAALIDGEDRISRARAAVAVFYTARGRVIGAPSVSPSRQLWTTLKAGSDHVFGQAISQLVELSDERWGTDTGT